MSPWRLEERCVGLNSGHRLCFFGELLKAPIQPPLVVCSVLQNHTCESGEIRRRRKYFYHSPLISFICWIVKLRIRCNGISSPGLAHIKMQLQRLGIKLQCRLCLPWQDWETTPSSAIPFFSRSPLLPCWQNRVGKSDTCCPIAMLKPEKKTRVFCYSTSYSLFISFKCDENCTNRGTKI